MRIERDELTHPAVVALIELHVRAAFANSPSGRVFALDLSALRDPSVTMWSAWDGDVLLGIGALKRLDAMHGELKSMRVHPAHARRGIGRAMLDHLIEQARAAGFARVSLETGSNDAFLAARMLYEGAGFVRCGPFAGYSDESFSLYYTRTV